MAKFKIDDWVQVTPQPDQSSSLWDPRLHNFFCGKTGRITDIDEVEADIQLYRVVVEFDDTEYQYGSYAAWFQGDHLIKTSAYEQKRKKYRNEKFDEYLKTEESFKKKRDKFLKQVFSDPSYIEVDKKSSKLDTNNNYVKNFENEDDWYLYESAD